MTDYEKLKKLLDDFGVGYVEWKYPDKKTIHIEEGSLKVSGWSGFYAEFVFTEDGKFIEVGCWE